MGKIIGGIKLNSINSIIKRLRENRILNEREDYNAKSSEDLIKMAQGGDQLAVETLFNRYDDFLGKMTSKYFLNSGDADDVRQIANIAFWKAIMGYDRGDFEAYAGMMIKRSLTDAIRSEETGKSLINTNADSMDAPMEDDEGGESTLGDRMASRSRTPEEEYLHDEYVSELKKYVEDHFSDKEKEVFRLKFLKDMKNDDIAEVTGMTYKQVGNALVRIKDKMRDFKNSIKDSKKPRTDEDLEFTEEETKIMKSVMSQIFEDNSLEESTTKESDWVVVNVEPRLSGYARLVPVKVDKVAERGQFFGWANGERQHEYDTSQIIYTAKSEEDARKFISSKKGMTTKEVKDSLRDKSIV